MTSYQERLASFIEAEDEGNCNGQKIGNFSTDGIVSQSLAIKIDDVGRLGFPLSVEQAASLISKMEQVRSFYFSDNLFP